MGQYAWLMGDQERYIELSQRALAIAEIQGDFDTRVLATYYLGGAYQTLGDYPRAIDYLRRAERFVKDPFWKAPSSGPISVVARLYLSWSLAEVGDVCRRQHQGRRSTPHRRSSRGDVQPYRSVFRHGPGRSASWELERAIARARTRLGTVPECNLPFWFPRVGSALGFAYT